MLKYTKGMFGFQTFNKFNDANCANLFEFQWLLPQGHNFWGAQFFIEVIPSYFTLKQEF